MNTINVVVGKRTSTGIVTSNPVTLKPDTNFTVLSSGGAVELTQLTDVDVSQELDGSVLQFNGNTNTYQVKPLVIDDGQF